MQTAIAVHVKSLVLISIETAAYLIGVLAATKLLVELIGWVS
jgi:FlaA1/EpsC-like NDP-sugar epimerase